MWPSVYWNPRYWNPLYWERAAVVPVPPVPPDVITVISHGWIPPTKRPLEIDWALLTRELERQRRRRRQRRTDEEMVLIG